MPAIPAIITGVATVYGAHEAAKGNTDAAKTSAQSDAAALAQAKEIYEQQRQDQGPYRESGYGALDALNTGLGLPAVNRGSSTTPLPSSTVNGLTFPGSPQVPAESMNTLSQLGGAGGVTGPVWNQVSQKVNQAQQIANQKFAGTGATTKVKGPNGIVYLVPNEQLDAAKQAGGQVVQ